MNGAAPEAMEGAVRSCRTGDLLVTADRSRPTAACAGMSYLQNNQVYAARYRYLTSREANRLKPTQAQTIVAAAILRQLYAVVATGQAWDPDIAAHGTRRLAVPGVVAA